ncbi:MAG: hypothetical protein R3Y28_04015 [Candidatus Gastranaerophilales bacterium]
MKKELKQSIKEKETQLIKLAEHVEKSSVCAKIYDKVVLEKAILKKELDELEVNFIKKTVLNFIPRKETLVCDYFKSR